MPQALCPYCDFNSHRASGDIPETAYIAALLSDLDQDAHWLQARPLQVFLLAAVRPAYSAWRFETFKGLKERIDFVDDIEITMEANPGSFEAKKFAGYRHVGINRLSLGVQVSTTSNCSYWGASTAGTKPQRP